MKDWYSIITRSVDEIVDRAFAAGASDDAITALQQSLNRAKSRDEG